MGKRSVFYVTNRKHRGSNRFRPRSYGKQPSGDGAENLRFGRASLEVDEKRVSRALAGTTDAGVGDGNALRHYLTRQARSAVLEAYEERISDPNHPESTQPDTKLGSTEMFGEARRAMASNRDVLIFVHGYKTSWNASLGTAVALQEMLNRRALDPVRGDVMVVLFSWPSDGSMLPFTAYKSDRTDAKVAGYALGRALLKLRDYLASLQKAEFCWANINILCHSMGNFVLQNALERAVEHSGGGRLPRLFDQSFLCSADVDDDVFSHGGALVQLPELSREVSIFTNRGDIALHVSDYTKGHPKRLGSAGAAMPSQLHGSVHQIDCSSLVGGIVEHSYYLDGDISRDIRMSLDSVPQDAESRPRTLRAQTNLWQARSL